MSGELLAMRRAALGAPIAEYSGLVNRARINKGGRGTGKADTSSSAASTSGVAVAASATPHSEGAFVEMIAASTFTAETIELTMVVGTATTGDNSSTLLDIAFGAAASEVVQISNIAIGFAQTARTIILPYLVPAGTRVSARIQGATASETPTIALILRQAGTHSAAPTSAVTYNDNAATSNATTVIASPGAINTESAWTEIIASTSADMRFFFPGVTGPATGTITAAASLIDFAVGGSGSEVAFLSNIGAVTSAAETLVVIGGNTAHPVSIPAGSRISARYQSDSTVTAARPNVIPIGFY